MRNVYQVSKVINNTSPDGSKPVQSVKYNSATERRINFLQKGMIFFKTGKMIKKVLLSDIGYVLACGNYCKCYIVGTSNFIVISLSMKEMENILPCEDFIRIHKSYIVPFDKIDKIENNIIYINNASFPIGRDYKGSVYSTLLAY
jgi:Response regulator of the LytR/AlgR family